MNFITSNKSITITILLAGILLGYIYLMGTLKERTPQPRREETVTVTNNYTALLGAQSLETKYLELILKDNIAELTSLNLSTGSTTTETGTYTEKSNKLTLTLVSKGETVLQKPKILEFDKVDKTLRLTNQQESDFGPEGVIFYKPKQDLNTTNWYWEGSDYANDTKIEPTDKTKFMLTFKSDGSFESTTDCNSLSGNYYLAGDELKFGNMVSTLMFCDGSLEPEYTKDLREIYTYIIEGTKLYLTLPLDSGTMKFSKVN
ncbi:MAG: hypothetical protein RLY61_685 [Candidatus Parcubacteria bacterium]